MMTTATHTADCNDTNDRSAREVCICKGKSAAKTITYYRRGLIERGADYHWTEGWSAQSDDNRPLYPWNTKRECQRDAKSQGAKAVFVRDEKHRLA